VARPTDKGFETHDIDFFLGRNYLVTVHHYMSRSIAEEQEVVLRWGPVVERCRGPRARPAY